MAWVLIVYNIIASSTLVLMQDQLPDLQSKRLLLGGTHSESSRPVVRTDSGRVRGVTEDGVQIFKGIPYAEAPINEKRWKPPVPVKRTSGIRDASTFGSQCVQQLRTVNYPTPTGSEDCLFLNVWAPIRDKSAPPLPVIVWIHGGGLTFGSGNDPGYSPSAELVTNMGFVFVSMNYRMGAFGFLSLDLLDTISDTGASGNYGYMDQIQVLKWVQTNIRNFGGDPNKVTIMGQSAGGCSVIALLSSPLARGLFHRAWVSSPAPLINKTADQAKIDNKIFLTNSGCQNVSCLRGLTSSQVYHATPFYVPPDWALKDSFDLPVKGVFNGGMAIVDGYVLPESPLDAWRNGKGNSVPTVFGSTGQELEVFNTNPGIANWTWREYRTHVSQKLDTFGPHISWKALGLYSTSSSVTPELQYSSMGSDIRVTCPTEVVADVADSYFNASVYRYVVTQAPSAPIVLPSLASMRYAFHGWDTYAFFGSLGFMMGHLYKSEAEFIDNIRQEVKHFVETGSPQSTTWLPFKINTAVLGSNTTIIDFYNKVRCSFWMKNGFFPYAWAD